jgi:hypothetical protein
MRIAAAMLLTMALIGCNQKPAATPPSSTGPTPNVDVSKLKNQRRFPLASLATTPVTINGHKITCWIMDDDAKEAEGLMWLQDDDVKASQGMLFVFSSPAQQSFWMHNTYIPLSIVYISKEKKVLNVAHGSVLDDTPLPSEGEAQYVLELKDPDASSLKIVPGTKVNFSDSIKAN